jgi:hypothetical protein
MHLYSSVSADYHSALISTDRFPWTPIGADKQQQQQQQTTTTTTANNIKQQTETNSKQQTETSNSRNEQR